MNIIENIPGIRVVATKREQPGRLACELSINVKREAMPLG
jgi:hypothetical protein